MAQKNSKKLSFIGENIKKIRQVKRISQAEFSALFNLARPSIGAYEEGRSEPKIDTIIQIANHFRISIDVLLTRKLTVSDIYSMGVLNQKLNKAHNISATMQEPTPIPDHSAIRLIEVKQYLEYIVNHNANDFIHSLRAIQLPIEHPYLFRAFEMNGSEMEYHQQGLHHGDFLIGQRVEVSKIKKHTGKILTIVHEEGIITRRLQLFAENQLLLTSDDPNYPDMYIDMDHVHEMWCIHYVFSAYLNPPSLLEERVMQLEKDISALKNIIK